MSNSDSVALEPLMRLVTPMSRDIEMFTAGTGAPVVVGVPPVQVTSKSATSSARPSDRAIDGTPTFAVH